MEEKLDYDSIDFAKFPNLSYMSKEDAIKTAIEICHREGREVTEKNIRGFLNNLDMEMAYR